MGRGERLTVTQDRVDTLTRRLLSQISRAETGAWDYAVGSTAMEHVPYRMMEYVTEECTAAPGRKRWDEIVDRVRALTIEAVPLAMMGSRESVGDVLANYVVAQLLGESVSTAVLVVLKGDYWQWMQGLEDDGLAKFKGVLPDISDFEPLMQRYVEWRLERAESPRRWLPLP